MTSIEKKNVFACKCFKGFKTKMAKRRTIVRSNCEQHPNTGFESNTLSGKNWIESKVHNCSSKLIIGSILFVNLKFNSNVRLEEVTRNEGMKGIDKQWT